MAILPERSKSSVNTANPKAGLGRDALNPSRDLPADQQTGGRRNLRNVYSEVAQQQNATPRTEQKVDLVKMHYIKDMVIDQN